MNKLYRVAAKFRENWEANYSTKKYHFFALEELEAGDLVVVETKYGPQVAKVTDTRVPADKFVGQAFVIQKIDEGHVQAMREKIAKAEMLKEEIEERIRETMFAKQVEELATNDPELADLLNQLKNI